MIYSSSSKKRTQEIASSLANDLKGGEVILLSGFLGSGKTVFAKAVAKSLGIKEAVTSPTFTIMNLYKSGRLQLCHCDAYRLTDFDCEDIGVLEYMGNKDTVTIIEWPENLKEDLSIYNIINISIKILGENKREIEIV